MLVGRFFLIVPALAIAGSLARKQPVPPSAGTFPTGTPLFAGLLVGVVLIVVGLTYFPVLALGPIVEHLLASRMDATRCHRDRRAARPADPRSMDRTTGEARHRRDVRKQSRSLLDGAIIRQAVKDSCRQARPAARWPATR